MTNKNTFIQNHNDEIDLKQVFKTIFKYKFFIFFTVLVFTIGSTIFAYIKPSIYSSTATIEVKEEERGWNSSSALKEAFSGAGVNIENQIEVFKSKFLADRAASYLSLGTRYYTVHNYRTYEFYLNSPFVVSKKFLDDMMYGKKFHIIPIDANSFKLIIKPKNKWSKDGILNLLGVRPFEAIDNYSYEKVHKYGEEINNEWFNITVQKIRDLESDNYQFNFVHKSSFSNYYADLSISQVSEFASVLRLSIMDTVSTRAKDLLNAILKAYRDQERERKNETANLSLDFIDSQLEEINKRLKTSEGKLEEYKETNEVIDLSQKAKMTSEKLAEYESKLQEISIEENILKNLQQYISKNHNLSGLAVGSINFADPSLANMVKI